jgi:membrane protease subunit HflK
VQVPDAVRASQLDSVKADADKERMVKEAQASANLAIPQAQGLAESKRRAAAAYKEQQIQKATGDVARFNQMLAAYEKSPAVTRERLYLEALEDVLSRSRKVIVDQKGGNGNMIYLPLDKLTDRGSRDSDSSGATVRPSVTVEPDTAMPTDARQRAER